MSTVIKTMHREGPTLIVDVQGEVDLRHSPDFHKRMIEACREQPELLLLDLHDVTYMDSSGVGTLVDLYRRARSYGGRLVLVAPTERVRSVFEITKLDQFFTIKNSREEALGPPGADEGR